MKARPLTGLAHVLVYLAILMAPATALAQSSVGAGPLTGTLTETEPTSGVLSLGPLKLAPGIVIREIGWDSNIFEEAINPKEDFVAAALPDVAIFSRMRFLKISAYAAGEFVYYRKYVDERSTGHAERGRVDFLLSRMRPFVAGGQMITRTSPNGEIDTRADEKTDEVSGGFAFDWSAHGVLYVAGSRDRTAYQDAFEEGVDLGLSLNRATFDYSAGVRTDLTPLLSLTLEGSYSEDEFKYSPERNSNSRHASATFRIGAEAVASGAVTLGFRDFKADDPTVEPYRGFVGSAGIAYPFLEVGRFGLTASRSLEYSFDETQAYYVESALNLGYTHQLFGGIDAQIKGGRSLFDYGNKGGSVPRTDTLDIVSGGIGYNLRNRTRVSLNYEYSRRRSRALSLRNYERRRLFASWTYAL
jgi:hypothetical protein